MISLIVAFDQNQLIGVNNQLPWHYKEDLKYFKETTTGHDILMGRHTFETILSYQNKPLPNRHHIVLTKQMSYNHEQVTITDNLNKILANYQNSKELFVIGGRSIYEQTLPIADRLYITHIDATFEGDTYFPEINWDEWRCIKEKKVQELRFNVYERVSKTC